MYPISDREGKRLRGGVARRIAVLSLFLAVILAANAATLRRFVTAEALLPGDPKS
jgi:hypothetical protein